MNQTNIKKIFDNTISHTYSHVNSLEALKFDCRKDKTLITTHTPDRRLIVTGVLNSGFVSKPTIFGCMRLQVLSTCLNFELFNEENSRMNVETKNDVPYSLMFGSEYGHTAEYRLTSEAILKNHITLDHMIDINWDVKAKIHGILYDQFRKVSAPFARDDTANFTMKDNEDGYLYFCIGDGGQDMMEFPVLEKINNAKWNSSFKWPIKYFQSVMRICNAKEYNDIEVFFSEKHGIVKIEPSINDDVAWQYYMIASK